MSGGDSVDNPDWSDESLSKDLAVLRSRGEGQELEYMEEFPKNTRELAREIAAFATSNAGTILIGVSDSGDLVGLPSAKTSEGRDQLVRRLEGISRGTVKPAVTPIAKFAVEGAAVVLVLTIPKGKQPVYYSGSTPYVRHLTEARPAEPHEVVELVTESLAQPNFPVSESESDGKGQLYSEVARNIIEVLVFADEAPDRQVNPWLDIWRAEFDYAASELRELAANDIALEEGVDTELRELADLLDNVANLQLYLGSGAELEKVTSAAANRARQFMMQHIDSVPLNESSLEHVRDLIITSSRKLSDIVARADSTVEAGRIEELQTEVSDLGHSLVRASYYNIEPLGVAIGEDLRKIGRALHRTETIQLYMDGGASMRAVLDHIATNCNALFDLAKRLQ